MLYLNLRMAFIIGLENHFIFNFCLNRHKKNQSLKTEEKKQKKSFANLLLTQNRNFFCQNNLIITKTK